MWAKGVAAYLAHSPASPSSITDYAPEILSWVIAEFYIYIKS